MYYVYVIKSLKDKKLYVGHTNNLVKRFKEHNTGMVESTQKRKPFKLVYYESCNILNDAIKREKSLKTGFGRTYLKRRISDIQDIASFATSGIGPARNASRAELAPRPPATLSVALRAGSDAGRGMKVSMISSLK